MRYVLPLLTLPLLKSASSNLKNVIYSSKYLENTLGSDNHTESTTRQMKKHKLRWIAGKSTHLIVSQNIIRGGCTKLVLYVCIWRAIGEVGLLIV